MADSSSRYLKVFFLLLFLTAAGFFLSAIGELVRLLIIAALLAYILDPIAAELESHGLSRIAATGIVFLMIGLAMYLFGFFVVPALVREIQTLSVSSSANQASAIVADLQKFINQKLSAVGLREIDLDAKIQDVKRSVGEQLLGYLLTQAVPFITQMVIVPFIIFFLMKDGRKMRKAFISVIPNRYFELSLNLIYKMDQQLGFYLRGQFLDAVIFGILSTLALWILGVKYFLFIGIFAGVANLIPYVGPLAGVSLAGIMTVLTTGDITRVAYVVLAFIAIKLIDDSVVQPVVIARSVDMHPLAVLLAVIIGGEFFGIMGMLLSVPCAGFVKVMFQASRTIIRRYKLA